MTAGNLAELLRAVAVVTHEAYTDRDAARADAQEWRQRAEIRASDADRRQRELADVRRLLESLRTDAPARLAASVADDLQAALDGEDARVLAVVAKAQVDRLRALVGGRDRIEATGSAADDIQVLGTTGWERQEAAG